MKWVLLVAYFAVCSAVLIPFNDIYGKVLLVVGRAGVVVKMTGSVVAWFFMSIVLVSPLFGGVKIGYNLLDIEIGDISFIIFTCLLYAMSVIPGVLFFRNKYLESLKALGFFVDRRGG